MCGSSVCPEGGGFHQQLGLHLLPEKGQCPLGLQLLPVKARLNSHTLLCARHPARGWGLVKSVTWLVQEIFTRLGAAVVEPILKTVSQ